MPTPIDIRDSIAFPRRLVWLSYRDRLVEMLPFLPSIRSIEVEKREEEQAQVRLLNLWKAKESEVPAVARPFVKSEMLEWRDYATWKEDVWRCEWRTELSFLKEAIHCSGVNEYSEVNGNTEIRILGEISVDGSKIPKVPRFMAPKLASTVEAFVCKVIKPNLVEINRGLERFLREHPDDIADVSVR